MRRIIPLALCLFSLVIMNVTLTFAQIPSIADGVVVLSSGVTVGVLREASTKTTPNYCSTQTATPPPPECVVNNGSSCGWLGCDSSLPVGVDAIGSAYQIHFFGPPIPFADGDGTLMRRVRPDGTTEDVARFYRVRCLEPSCSSDYSLFYFNTPLYLDVTNGRILIFMFRSVRNASTEVDSVVGILEISGLPKLFDTLLTFEPSAQTLSTVTPAHPDGFRSADSLQVWAGDIRTLPDWSQAQALTCNAATQPTPGQIVTITDTLSDPAVSQGRYYLTASVNGTDRRLGRQYVNGAFSARDPAILPVCQ
jgi:hypothetical protein